MSEHEHIEKSTVSVTLPRKFYNFYMECHLWDEYSSYSDWVRDCLRRDMVRIGNKRELEQYTKKTRGEKIQEEFDKQ
ncbi:hypothetical protein E3J49_02610 [Candidatus Bathyarchaeota archaeon]|nr:MAG: hypothetical protein E3J49_02610 [Candidatus Bathyarchaeota archaeon]